VPLDVWPAGPGGARLQSPEMAIHDSVSPASSRGRARRVRSGGRSVPLLMAAFAVGAVILTNLVDSHFYALGIRLLNANLASSWSHRADAAILAAATIVAILGALQSGARRRLWISIALIMVFFMFDEISSLHAHVDHLTRFGQISYGKLLYAPILLVLVICVARLAAGTDQVLLMFVGLITLLVSYVIHVLVLSLAIGWGYDSWSYQTIVGLKEGAALGGLVLLLAVMWRLQRRVLSLS